MAFGINIPVGFKLNNAGLKSAHKEFSSFGSSLKKGLALAGVSVGIGTVVDVLKGSVKAASDLNESLNAVNVAYGKNANKILELGQNSAKAVGLSRNEFNALAVGFSSFSQTIAGKGGSVVGVFKTLSQRGADFASVFNLEGGVNQAMDLFRSGLAGETEPLRKFGIDMSAAAVETFALTSHLVKNKKQLTESIKVQARYGLLMQSTSKTQGDFANTFGGLANQQRFMAATIEDLQAKFGALLLPMMQKVAVYINDKVIPVVSKFVDDLSNPKSDAGKMFLDIKKAVEVTFNGVRDFFALFGNGDAMKGFGNIATAIIKMLPALLALKGIMMLSAAGSSIRNLISAVSAIRGVGGGGGGGGGDVGAVPIVSTSTTPTKVKTVKTVAKKVLGAVATAETTTAVAQGLGMNADTGNRLGLIAAAGSKWKLPGLIAGAILGSLSGDSAGGGAHTLKENRAFEAEQRRLNKNATLNPGLGILMNPNGATGGSFMNGNNFATKRGPTTINVNVQPGTSGPETAKAIVKLLGSFDRINGTNIVTKPGR